MVVVFRTAVLAVWILGVGLVATCIEAHRIRIGHRIHNLLRQSEETVERVRRLEIRYNRMVSPDLLLKEIPESFLPEDRSMALGKAGRSR